MSWENDEIERLGEQIAALTAERDRYITRLDETVREVERLHSEVRRLTGQVERIAASAAPQKAQDMVCVPGPGDSLDCRGHGHIPGAVAPQKEQP